MKDLLLWEDEIREHSEHIARILLPFLPQQGTFLDIGANVGLVTQAILRERPDVRAICFEPVAEYAERCQYHNPTAHVRPCGLSQQYAALPLAMDTENLGLNSLLNGVITNPAVRYIPVCPLDGMSIPRPVHLVKIDVEGWEHAVVDGMSSVIAHDHPVLLIEAWDTPVEIAGYTYALVTNTCDYLYLPIAKG